MTLNKSQLIKCLRTLQTITMRLIYVHSEPHTNILFLKSLCKLGRQIEFYILEIPINTAFNLLTKWYWDWIMDKYTSCECLLPDLVLSYFTVSLTHSVNRNSYFLYGLCRNEMKFYYHGVKSTLPWNEKYITMNERSEWTGNIFFTKW